MSCSLLTTANNNEINVKITTNFHRQNIKISQKFRFID